MDIIAHRGASHDAPENTLASLNLAWEQRADAAEIDVRLTRDGQIVAIHDATTKRTAGGRDWAIAEHTLAELQQLDAGRWKHERFAGERVPTLGEILTTIPNGKRLFIEIKTGPEIVPALIRVLHDADLKPEQTPLISFYLEVIRAVKSGSPERPAYWIVQLKRNEQGGAWTPTAAELLRHASELGADGVDVGNAPELDAQDVEPLRHAGLALYTWTVNTVVAALRFQDLKFDGVTTDCPGWLREQIAAHSS